MIRNQTVILLFVLLLSFSVAVTVNGQEKQKKLKEVQGEKTEDSDKSAVILKIIKKPRPELGNRCGISGSGTVQLRVTFHESGKVTHTEVVSKSSCNAFDKSAQKAALKIKFEVATKNGQPITVTKIIEYNFAIY